MYELGNREVDGSRGPDVLIADQRMVPDLVAAAKSVSGAGVARSIQVGDDRTNNDTMQAYLQAHGVEGAGVSL